MNREPIDHSENERQISQRSGAELREEIELCDAMFNFLTEGFNLLRRPIELADERRVLIIQLVTLGYNSLRQALHSLMHGYYTQAIGLTRTAWEAWLHGAYLRLFDEIPVADWLNFSSRPKPVEMRRRVAERSHPADPITQSEFLENLGELYSGYSDYSHPGDQAVQVLVAKDKTGDLSLRLGGSYDPQLFRVTTNLFGTAGYLLSTLLAWDLSQTSEPFQEYFDKGKAIVAQVNNWRERFAPGDEPLQAPEIKANP